MINFKNEFFTLQMVRFITITALQPEPQNPPPTQPQPINYPTTQPPPLLHIMVKWIVLDATKQAEIGWTDFAVRRTKLL
jgi:hypothetical protein